MVDEPLARHARPSAAADAWSERPGTVRLSRLPPCPALPRSSPTSNRASGRSRSSSPRRGGSRTPGRHPRPTRRRINAELARRELLADPDAFAAVRAARAAADPTTDPLVAASSTCSTTRSSPTRCRPISAGAIVELETAVESTFNNFRGHDRRHAGRRQRDRRDPPRERRRRPNAEPRGKRRSRSGPRSPTASASSPGSATRRRATLGYRDHFALALATGELDEDRLFDDARRRRPRHREPVHRVEARRRRVARRRASGARVDELRPWHFDDPFFQSPPAEGAVAIDHFFADADLEALTLRTYDGLGLDVRAGARAQRSLRPRREEPARVLHRHRPRRRRPRAVQRRAQRALDGDDAPRVRPRDLRPRVASGRSPGSSAARRTRLTTEGIAMLFGRLTRDPDWLASGRRRRPPTPSTSHRPRARRRPARRAARRSPAGCS